MAHNCRFCTKSFHTAFGLTQHMSVKHQGKIVMQNSQRQRRQRLEEPVHDANLWDTPVVKIQRPSISTEIHTSNMGEMDDMKERAYYDISSDLKDIRGATIDDALDSIEGKNNPQILVGWPNDAYHNFMELVIEGNISNKIGDKIIKFFNKHSNLEESPLPRSTKSGKDYLSQIRLPSIDFKEKVVANYSGVDITLHYRPIIRLIQTLLERPNVAENFALRGTLNKKKIPRFPGLKLFNKLGQLKVMTAADYRHIMKVILFALDDIFDRWNQITCKELCKLYTRFSKMYIMSQQESFTEIDLKNFEDQWSGPLVPHKKNPISLTIKIIIKLFIANERFGKVLWELKLDAIDEKVKSLKSSNQIHPNYIEGLSEIVPALYAFLDTPSQDSVSEDFYVKVYDTVHLESGEILRTSDNFQGKEWFSNVAVSAAEDQIQYESDEGIWYGRLLIFLRFYDGLAKDPYNLAMIRWYDIEPIEPELY
ncbi:24484_t:CDS:2, partial [Dentiscutata erythropus]